MFFDDLANLIELTRLEGRLQDWIAENVASTFSDILMTESSPDKLDSTFGRFQEDDLEVIIDLWPVIESSLLTESTATVCCPALRLMTACSRRRDGTLEGVDALLVCGMVAPKEDEPDTDKVAWYWWHALNLLRTLIDAFVTEQLPEYPGTSTVLFYIF